MNAEEKTVAVILAAYIFESSDEDGDKKMSRKRKRKPRSLWVKDWVSLRAQEGFCAKLYKELRINEPRQYKNFWHIDVKQFDYLLSLVTPLISKKDTVMRKSISASDRLILTFRCLANGDNFRSLQYLFRIPWCTISTIIPELLDALYKVLVNEYLQTPRSPEAWEEIARDFNELWQFSNLIGAVDGKWRKVDVVMVAPPHSGSNFFNYKGNYSIVLMGIAGPTYNLIYVEVGRNGRFSDGGIFNRCTFAQAMDRHHLNLPLPKPLPGRQSPVPYTLVADDAFALRPGVLKPHSHRGLTMVKRVFNYRLSRARRIIDNVFGIMSARYRVLRKPIQLSPEKTKKVVLACCVLHNYLMSSNKNIYASPGTFDRYNENDNLIPGDWRQESSLGPLTLFPLQIETDLSVLSDAKDIQAEFASYFVEEGELDWQYKYV